MVEGLRVESMTRTSLQQIEFQTLVTRTYKATQFILQLVVLQDEGIHYFPLTGRCRAHRYFLDSFLYLWHLT